MKMKRHIWQASSILGSLAVGGLLSYFTQSPIPWVICGTLAFILLIIYCFWNRIGNLIYKVTLEKCPNIHKLSDDLYQEQIKYRESQQAISQAKDDLAYIISKILPLSKGTKELSIGEDLAQHAIHLSLILDNPFGFHIEIESIVPKILIDSWELGGECEVSNSWANINSCQIVIEQSISPTVANGLRQKEEKEINLGCDLTLNIWLKDANIRSQARYSFNL